MKYHVSFCVALLLTVGSVSTAEAVVVFSDNFDGYANQAAFEAVWTPIGCTNQGASCTGNVSTLGGTLSQATVLSSPNSVLIHSPPATAPGTSDLSQRNQAQFPITSTLAVGEKLVFSFDFHDITGTGNPYRQFVNLQTIAQPINSNQLVSMGLNNNLLAADQDGNYYMARILGGASNGGTASQYFKLNDAGAPLRSAGWHNLKVEISTSNGTTQDYRFYVDNALSETVVNVGAAVRQYEFIRLGAGVSSGSDASYDNVRLEYIPVPANVEGDYNGNGKVDGADYVIWRKNKGLTGGATVSQGDGTLDGNVLDDDYTYWRDRFGNPSSGSGSSLTESAVPEPAAGVSLLISAIAMVAACRHAR